MKKIHLLTVLLVLSLTLCGALPSFAGGKAQIMVNGDQVDFFNVFVEEGYSMVSVDAFARFAGAGVNNVSGDTVQITEEGKTLQLTLGKVTALLDNKPVSLPCAPVKLENKFFVPLRFICETFGFDVSWDSAQRMVALNRIETRDGMTALDLLIKSNKVCQDINTYSMSGNMDMQMKIQADGKEMAEVPTSFNVEMNGQIKNDPLEFYFKQKLTPTGQVDMPEMTTETYMTAEKMYMKTPEQDEWIVQDMPFSADFWKEQQDIQSDPLKAAAQMKEMGMLLNFSDDIQLDGKDYYVVNATLDMNKFQEGYQKIIEQMTQGMNIEAGNRGLDRQLQKLMESMQLDYYYQAFINKESLVTDIIKFEMRVDLNMNAADFKDMEPEPGDPEKINVNFDMRGEFHVYDPGEPFVAPDVSNARELNTTLEPAADEEVRVNEGIEVDEEAKMSE